MKPYYVYILSSHSKVLYIGVTNNLITRVWQHREGLVEGFSKKYKTHALIYYEITTDIRCAISREKQLKNWRREKKEILINSMNPEWTDLYRVILDSSTPSPAAQSLGMTK